MLFLREKKVSNPHMHTLLKMLEHFRSAAEVGFLFHVGSFYLFYVNKVIAENIFKWRFKPIRWLVGKERGASIIPALGVSLKSQFSADVCLGQS